ncbi:Ig-like domain-containing protein [Planctomycetaceae bacterium SH139]
MLVFYPDVNGNENVTPLDALVVINHLSKGNSWIAPSLIHDTGPDGETNFDRVTSDHGIQATFSSSGLTVELQVGGASGGQFIDVTDFLEGSELSLPADTLDSLLEAPLTDGEHEILLRSSLGDLSQFTITLDRQGPQLLDTGQPPVLQHRADWLELEFDEPLGAISLQPADYRLFGIDGTTQDETTEVEITHVSLNEGGSPRLDLTMPLPNGSYRLEVLAAAVDLAGNSLAVPSREFSVDAITRVLSVSPEPGAALVSVTRDVVVRFDYPLDASTINTDNFRLRANGQILDGTATVSSTGRFVIFKPAAAMPPSTEIEVELNGGGITDVDGSQVDLNGDGQPGGRLQSYFRTLPMTRIPNTNVFGYVRDSVTGEPIAGATIRVDAFPDANVVTDSSGRFELVDMPAPDFFVHIDGRTAQPTAAGRMYPNVGKPFHSVPGETVQIEMDGEPFDIYLPAVAATDVAALSETETRQVGFGAGGLDDLETILPGISPERLGFMQVEFTPGAAVDAVGQVATEAVIIPVAPSRIPAPLPPNLEPNLVISIQAGRNLSEPNNSVPAVRFDTPARVTFPNTDNLPVGEQTLIFSFDHDAGKWIVVGSGTVVITDSTDEQGEPITAIVSNGPAIQAPGWHFTQPGVTVDVNLHQPWQDGLREARESYLGKVDDQLASFFPELMKINAAIDPVLFKEASRIVQGVDFADRMRDCEFRGQYPSCWDVIFAAGLSVAADITRNPWLQAASTLDSALGVIRTNREVETMIRDFERAKQAAAEHMALIEGIQDSLDEIEALNNDMLEGLNEMAATLERMHQQLTDFEREANAILDRIEATIGSRDSSALSTPEGQQQFIDDLQTSPSGTPAANTNEIVLPPTPIVPPNTYAPADNPPTESPTSQPEVVQELTDQREQDGQSITYVPAPNSVPEDVGDTLATAHLLDIPADDGRSFDSLLGDNLAGENDVDLYAFDANEGDTISADLHRLNAKLALATLRIFAADGSELTRDTESGLGRNASVPFFQLSTTGRYYVGVSSYGNDSYDPAGTGDRTGGNFTGEYRLSIRRWSGDVANRVRIDNALVSFALSAEAVSESLETGFYTRPSEQMEQIRGIMERFSEITTMPLMQPAMVAIEDQQGQIAVRGKSSVNGQFSTIVASNSSMRLLAYDPQHDLTFSRPIETGNSGSTVRIPWAIFGTDSFTDNDGDLLSDVAEIVVGTSSQNQDTDRDGISDFTEIQQGIDPLGGRGFPTGLIATQELLGPARQVVIAGNPLESLGQTAYVATGDHGLAILDVSDFDLPIVLGQLDLPGNAIDLAVDTTSQRVAVATESGGLQFIDVSNPMAPVVANSISTPAHQVLHVDGKLAVAGGTELRFYTMQTGELLSESNPTSHAITGLAQHGDYLYTMDTRRRMTVIDISNLQPQVVGSIQLSAGGGQLFAGPDFVLATVANNTLGGFVTVDVSDPAQPFEAAPSQAPQTSAPGDSLVANGSGLVLLAGIADRQAGNPALVQLVDWNSTTADEQTYREFPRIELPSRPSSITQHSGIAYLAAGEAGLLVVNYLPFDIQGEAPSIQFEVEAPDSEPQTSGLQVDEGTLVKILSEIIDDVQVRDVELLINETVVRRDTSFPFEFDFVAPNLEEANGEPLRVQMRATDTGGNVTLSDVRSVTLTADTTPPIIQSISLENQQVVSSRFRTIAMSFNEPIDAGSFSLATVGITNIAPGGATTTPSAARFRLNNRELLLTFPALPEGQYRLVVDQAGIQDVAGNTMSGPNLTRDFEVVAATAIWSSPNSGQWNDPANWVDGNVPDSEDDVHIPALDPDVLITIPSNGISIRSLFIAGDFQFNGGRWEISETLQVEGQLTLAGGTLQGATLLPSRSGTPTLVTRNITLEQMVVESELLVADSPTITLDNSSLNGTTSVNDGGYLGLGGTFQLSNIDGLQLAGDEVRLIGTLELGNQELVNGDRLGDWRMFGGTIKNGTISGTPLVASNRSSSLLQDITLNSDLILASDRLRIADSLTLNGTMQVDGNSEIYFVRPPNSSDAITQVIDGSGTLLFSNRVSNADNVVLIEDNITLEIAAGMTVSGGNVVFLRRQLPSVPDGVTLINRGTIEANLLDLNNPLRIDTTTWKNLGTMHVVEGAGIELGGTFVHADLGDFQADGGAVVLSGTLNLDGDTLTTGGSYGEWQLLGGAILSGTVNGSPISFSNRFENLLQGVTVNSDLIIANDRLRIADGLTLNGTMQVDGNSEIYFVRPPNSSDALTQVIDGSGTLQFTNNVSNAENVVLIEDNITLEIAAGVTVSGGNAVFLRRQLPAVPDGVTLINRGTIEANLIDLNNPLRIETTAWKNLGIMHVADGAGIELGGTFVHDDLGDFQADGGLVALIGILNLDGDTLTTGGSYGAWQILGGSIIGGTVNGVPLTFSNRFENLLQDVTINSDMVIANDRLRIIDGLTLNGTMQVDGNSEIYVSRGEGGSDAITQVIDGSGTIRFSNNVSNADNVVLIEDNVTLELAAGITVSGGNVVFLRRQLPTVPDVATLINRGTIEANLIDLNNPLRIETTSWTNLGTVHVAEGAGIELGGTFAHGDLGDFQADGGAVALSGTLNLDGDTLTTGGSYGEWQLLGGAILGGTVNGSPLLFSNRFENLLHGVTFNADLLLAGDRLRIIDGLTLNGTMHVDGNSEIYFARGDDGSDAITQIIDGTGMLQFSNSASNADNLVLIEDNVTLELAAGITVSGGNVVFLRRHLPTIPDLATMVNYGTIVANLSGDSIRIMVNVLDNFGQLDEEDGGSLIIDLQ